MRLFIRTSAILLALLATPVYAESHALIMTIGDYINGVTPLQGSKYDVPSARAIANKMGVKDQNIRYYKDAQLTVAGMQKAFDDLYQRVAENDQVFIYYSGHGGRWRISETDNRCAVALITVDGQGFMDTQIQAEFNRLATKAQKVVMFADACHSGGVKTRGIAQQWPEGMTPRFWAKQGPDACEVPVNLITNNLRTQTRSIGKGGNNFVYIAAARENEVSWDMGKAGGAATQAWRECITGAARDKDKSGGLSATEIQECAQVKMNQSLGGMEAQGVLPSHVTIAGNSNAVLAFVEPASQATAPAPAPAQPAPVAPVATKPPVPAPPPAVEVVRPNPPPPIQPTQTAPVATKPPAPTQLTQSAPVATKPPTQPTQTAPVATKPPAPTQVAEIAPVTTKPPVPAAPPAVEAALPNPPAYYTLSDVYNNRDDRRIVTLKPAKQRLKVGKDAFEFSLTSSHAGYVYLLMVGSDGKAFDMIFPNKLDSRNEISAGQTLQLPRPAWQITAAGPAGKDHLLAIVTDAPRDFSAIGMRPAGPFSVVEAAGSASRDIQLVSSTSANANSAECGASAGTRTLLVQKRCSSAYGAALQSIEEVD